MNQSQLPKFWTPEPVRAWRVFSTGSRMLSTLNSVTMSAVTWSRRMPPAQCVSPWAIAKRGPHEAPADNCSCGYWSLKPELLARPGQWQQYNPWPLSTVIYMGAVGWVESWGEIVEGEYGYRSEQIKLTALIDLPDEMVAPHIWVRESESEYVRTRLALYRSRLGRFADLFQIPVVMMDEGLTSLA